MLWLKQAEIYEYESEENLMQVVFFGHYSAMSKKKPQIVLILGLGFLAVVQRHANVIPKKYRIYFLSLVSLLH